MVYQLIAPDSNEECATRLVEQFKGPQGTFMCEYKVLKTFASSAEARTYAEENGIEDVELND